MKTPRLLLDTLALLAALTAHAEDSSTTVTYDFSKNNASSYNSDLDLSKSTQIPEVALTNGEVTLVCYTNDGTAAPSWVVTSSPSLRLFYASSSTNGNSMDISVSDGYVITGMTFTFYNSGHMPSSSSAFDTGSATISTSDLTATWTPTTQVSTVTFQNDYSTKTAWWITGLAVTYANGTIAWSANEASVVLGSTSYTLPTLSNPHSLEITYSSSNTDVATIDSVGDISLLATGTTTISATSTATTEYDSVTVSYTLTVTTSSDEEDSETEEEKDYFCLVTSADDLAEGDEITFACKDYGVCIGTIRSSGNNFSAVSVEITNDSLVLPDAGTSYTLGLSEEDGHWYFIASDGSYLCATGIGYNYLQATTTLDEYAHATISISEDEAHDAGVVFQGSTNSYYCDSLLYNTNFYLFACYVASTTYKQVPVQIYRKGLRAIDVTISSVGYATLYYGSYNLQVPSAVTAYIITTNSAKTQATLTALTAEEGDTAVVIPAGEPVVLFSQEPIDQQQAVTYSFPIVSSYTGSPSTTNELFGTDTSVTLSESGTTYYILSTDASGAVGFFWQSGSEQGASVSLEAHKCCLPVTSAADGQVRSLSICLPGDEDETDAISSVGEEEAPSAYDGVYTLSGQRMNPATRLPAGIYVIDGRKVLVR